VHQVVSYRVLWFLYGVQQVTQFLFEKGCVFVTEKMMLLSKNARKIARQ